IRKFFKEEDDRLREYQPFPKSARKIGSGGLAEMVAVFNALIVAALGIVLAMSLSLWIAALAGVFCFAAAIIVQFRFIASCYAEK
ncbi:MAG: hypothetical protein L0Y55_02985, partial [Anaerolineales bacterium]|nr:hypothetical protein [Anaerolineales bacterium]